MNEYEELKAEVEEIVRNARAAYEAELITREQMQDVTRIPLMDLSMAEQERRHVTKEVSQKG
jgi:hypothetical protein